MARVDFYQLSRDPVDKVLPAIARRVLDDGGRLLVVADERALLDRISRGLWEAGPASFLANDHADAPRPEVQPILLAPDCVATNGARNLALADGQWREEALQFERTFYVFDEATIDAARDCWRTLAKADGVTARFWRQEGGKWRQGP
jgi:DNA polymerase-3 subunit chi